MTDLRARFQTADELPAPDLWGEVETRALAMSAAPAPGPAWLLIGLTALLMVGIGSAILFGSGLIPVPVPSESPSPSRSGEASASPQLEPSTVPEPGDASTWTPTASMLTSPSEGMRATRLADGRVLVTGPDGLDEVLDPEDLAWDEAGNMVEPRSWHTATLLADGRVLVAGGEDYVAAELPFTSTEVYDPTSGTWTATGSMQEGRFVHEAVRLADGRVLVIGGQTWIVGADGLSEQATPVTSAELFDPTTETWFPTEAPPPSAHLGSAVVLRNGQVLYVAGAFGAYLYEPTTETWAATSASNAAGGLPVLLSDGRVLVVASFAGPSNIYDPVLDEWSRTAATTVYRSSFTATLLPDGRVLAAGGRDENYVFQSSAEIYNPATGSWTPTTEMHAGRMWNAGVSLLDGRVLVVGPANQEPWAEVYNPD